nr:FAD-dependent oxidoreductase [uncultured Gellertiella sp.]
MGRHFEHIIVGRGMTGSAAARHLAEGGADVALVGPGEPAEKVTHQGVFASHYDEGRITRTLDPDPVWGKLAARSIARYAGIERRSGIRFHEGRGCLYVASDPDRIAAVLAVASAEAATATLLDPDGLRRHFGYLAFPATCSGVHEPAPAGLVSPRRLVAAQAKLAAMAGATLLDSTVSTIREDGQGVRVTLREATTLTAERVLVATGGYSIAPDLLPDRLRLDVYGRTVVFFDIDEKEQARLHAMPSLIAKVKAPEDETYLLPPVRYPDGGVRLKIGGEPEDFRLEAEDLGDWFRSPGRAGAIDHLAAHLRARMPGLKVQRQSSAACVTTYTRSGHPMIGWAGKRIAVMTGGCGAAAKSSDEIGRLGAILLQQGTLGSEGYASDFPVDFA